MTRKRHTINQAVRFRDIDAMGHVNNATYFTYMEESRKEFFWHIFKRFTVNDFPFILANISCNFNKPARLEDKVVAVDIRITNIGRKSFTFKHDIYRPTDPAWIFATGESIQVFYDHQNNKTIEIPATFKEMVKTYLDPEDGQNTNRQLNKT